MNTAPRALVLVLSVLILAGAVVLAPLWPPLLLAAWFAVLVRPLQRRFSRWLGGRHRGAAALTVGLLLAILIPLIGMGVSLGYSAFELVERITTSEGGKRALQRLVLDRPMPVSAVLAPMTKSVERAFIGASGSVSDGGSPGASGSASDGGSAPDGGLAAAGRAASAPRPESVQPALQPAQPSKPAAAPTQPAQALDASRSPLVSSQWSALLRPERIIQLVREHGGQAYRALQVVAGATARALLGLFLFIFGAYSFLVSGPAWYHASLRYSPMAPRALRRLMQAFNETGRGLLIGVGLTALAQGTVATIAYLILRIPSAFVLGLLTAIGSLVPSVGSALVWVPVAAGLALTGRWVASLVLVAIGVLVIGTIDNILRPLFSRIGALQLPTFLLFLAIFGGVILFGGWGLLLGPLLLRLAREALAIAREMQVFRPIPPPR